MTYQFSLSRTAAPKAKPADPDNLPFGKMFTDHMFLMDFDREHGWHDGRIVPFAPIPLHPAAAVLHYSQTMFEGLKAYKTPEGQILLFRPEMNAKRTNRTNDRMCIPELPEELFLDAVKALVDLEREWIPDRPGTSLYIRPFIFADEAFLGVHPADHYLFCIITCPVGPYFKSESGQLPVSSIFVEDEYIRAAPGGTGFAKVGGNYAGGLKAQEKAIANGCEQVLWLDGVEKKYVEEIGSANAFFVINGEVITAPLTGTILPGVTRDSVITLLRKWGYTVSERRLSIDDLFQAAKDGTLEEVFASGTAAVISPVGRLVYQGHDLNIGHGGVGELSQKLYNTIYGIQTGHLPDDMGWTVSL